MCCQGSREQTQRFKLECELMKSVRHDNTVQRLGVTLYFGKPFLVMELMECNLKQYLEASPIPYCTARIIQVFQFCKVVIIQYKL